MRDIFGDFTFRMIEMKYGKMLSYHLPEFHKIYETLQLHPEIIQAIETGGYDVFVDVGAYVGLFTIAASYNCKKVIAYEASPFIFGILLYNTKFLKNVKCNYAWVGCDKSVPKIGKENNLYMTRVWETEEYNVPVVSLDKELHWSSEWLYPKMLIKMDIEGSEYDALEGATKLLKAPHIHWIVEIHEVPKLKLKEEMVLEYFKEREIIKIGDLFIYVK